MTTGCSIGKLALNRAGIHTENYFSSEVDPYCIEVSKRNFGDKVTQLGDVMSIDPSSLPKIDLLIGGSPCTDFSAMGKRKGMVDKTSETPITTLEQYLEIKKDGKEAFYGESCLFWEYVRLLRELSPTYFLLENVKMPEFWSDLISSTLETKGKKVDSRLVSAQHRPRYYWTNINGGCFSITSPSFFQDIKIKDIMDEKRDPNNVIDRKVLRVPIAEETRNGLIFVGGLESASGKRWGKSKGISSGNFSSGCRVFSEYGKMSTITSKGGGLGRGCNLIMTMDDERVWRVSMSERERMQNWPVGFTRSVPDNKRREIIGNGWTADIVKGIFNYI